MEMSAPKKIKLTSQRTLQSFFPTLKAVSTDDTQHAVSTDDQDSQLAENCENDTAASPEKPTDEIVTTAATTSTKPSSKEEDPISLEKGREEISTVFNDVLSEELKLHNYFLCYGKCTMVCSNTKGAFCHSWLADRTLSYDTGTGLWWLCYLENAGMYCLLCRKHDTINTRNKSKIWNDQPSVRLRKVAIQDHLSTE